MPVERSPRQPRSSVYLCPRSRPSLITIPYAMSFGKDMDKYVRALRCFCVLCLLYCAIMGANIMALKRTTIEELTEHERERGNELSVSTRKRNIQLPAEGETPTRIVRQLGSLRRTVSEIFRRGKDCPDGTSKPRSGRPPAYSERQKRLVVRKARRNPEFNKAECCGRLSYF